MTAPFTSRFYVRIVPCKN